MKIGYKIKMFDVARKGTEWKYKWRKVLKWNCADVLKMMWRYDVLVKNENKNKDANERDKEGKIGLKL